MSMKWQTCAQTAQFSNAGRSICTFAVRAQETDNSRDTANRGQKWSFISLRNVILLSTQLTLLLWLLVTCWCVVGVLSNFMFGPPETRTPCRPKRTRIHSISVEWHTTQRYIVCGNVSFHPPAIPPRRPTSDWLNCCRWCSHQVPIILCSVGYFAVNRQCDSPVRMLTPLAPTPSDKNRMNNKITKI